MSRGSAGIAKSAIAVLGIALAVVAIGGVSVAQEDPQAANAALDKGRDLFSNYGCANCHTLGDAGATGRVGPAFDGNANLSEDFIVDRVTNGQGMMPSFAGQMSADDIKTLAAYILKTRAK